MAPNSSNFESLLNQRVEAFVADISELARRHAVETLSRALDGGGIGGVTNGRRSVASADNGGGRRRPEDVEQQTEMLLGFIKKNPGKRAEQIAAEIGLSTKVLVLPMRKLTASKLVKTEGQKRATRYFPAGGGKEAEEDEPKKPAKSKAKPGKRKTKAKKRGAVAAKSRSKKRAPKKSPARKSTVKAGAEGANVEVAPTGE